MATLYLCEKPSQARDIARVLGAKQRHETHLSGSGITVTWALGHLLEQAPPEDYCDRLKPWRLDVLPVIPEVWKVKARPKVSKQLKAIAGLLEQADEVVVATDADREGETIGREILDHFKYRGTVKRLWLRALDDASIRKALGMVMPGQKTERLYRAGLGRQRADWLLGMNLTMATTVLFGGRGREGVLSVGRVQTPTLKLVVDRDRCVENFKPLPYYELVAYFSDCSEGEFGTKWQAADELTDADGRCLQRPYAEAVAAKIAGKQGRVDKFEEMRQKKSAPPCFSLSALQKLANARFGISAKDTLAIAQSLYEKHKATTYPRTDTGYLPQSQFPEAPDVLAALGAIDASLQPLLAQCNTSFKSPVWNDKKLTAHHGIIPTRNRNVNPAAMSDREWKIYDLIRRYYIAQFLGDCEFRVRKVEVGCEGERFAASDRVVMVPGWKAAIAQSDEDEDSEDSLGKIPQLQVGAILSHLRSAIADKQTKPPSRFTEGTLIAAMKSVAKYVEGAAAKKILKETAGIGTEATRAGILETLLFRGYLERKKKQLISTEKGRRLVDLLPDRITNPATTAVWEEELGAIAAGKGDLSAFLQQQQTVLQAAIAELSASQRQKPELRIVSAGEGDAIAPQGCPNCGAQMVLRSGSNGKFWGCSTYPQCKGTVDAGSSRKGRPKSPSRRKRASNSDPKKNVKKRA